MYHPDESPIEYGRRILNRAGIAVITPLFIWGLTARLAFSSSRGESVLGVACAILVAMPVLNVVAVLGEEIRRRDWPFVGAAAFVLLMLAISLLTRFR
jgi:uncharacterized membrane protein